MRPTEKPKQIGQSEWRTLAMDCGLSRDVLLIESPVKAQPSRKQAAAAAAAAAAQSQPRGTGAAGLSDEYGDGDGSWWDRWLTREPHTLDRELKAERARQQRNQREADGPKHFPHPAAPQAHRSSETSLGGAAAAAAVASQQGAGVWGGSWQAVGPALGALPPLSALAPNAAAAHASHPSGGTGTPPGSPGLPADPAAAHTAAGSPAAALRAHRARAGQRADLPQPRYRSGEAERGRMLELQLGCSGVPRDLSEGLALVRSAVARFDASTLLLDLPSGATLGAQAVRTLALALTDSRGRSLTELNLPRCGLGTEGAVRLADAVAGASCALPPRESKRHAVLLEEEEGSEGAAAAVAAAGGGEAAAAAGGARRGSSALPHGADASASGSAAGAPLELPPRRGSSVITLEPRLLRLVTLRLAGNGIGIHAGGALAAVLLAAPALVELDLARNPLAQGGAELCAAMGTSRSLRRVSLRGCALGDAGAHAAADALERTASLLTVDLAENGIAAAGAAALSYALLTNPRRITHSLELADNPIGREGGRALLRAVAVAADAAYTVRIGTDGCNLESGGGGGGDGGGAAKAKAKATVIDVLQQTASVMDPAWPVGSFRLRLDTTYGRGVARELLARRAALGDVAVRLSDLTYDGEPVGLDALECMLVLPTLQELGHGDGGGEGEGEGQAVVVSGSGSLEQGEGGVLHVVAEYAPRPPWSRSMRSASAELAEHVVDSLAVYIRYSSDTRARRIAAEQQLRAAAQATLADEVVLSYLGVLAEDVYLRMRDVPKLAALFSTPFAPKALRGEEEQETPVNQHKVRALALLMPRVVDVASIADVVFGVVPVAEGADGLDEHGVYSHALAMAAAKRPPPTALVDLTAAERAALREELGPFDPARFDQRNPTRRYALELREPFARAVAVRLLELSNSRARDCQPAGFGDTSQHGDGSCFRNATLDGRVLRVRAGWRVPSAGRFECDFALPPTPRGQPGGDEWQLSGAGADMAVERLLDCVAGDAAAEAVGAEEAAAAAQAARAAGESEFVQGLRAEEAAAEVAARETPFARALREARAGAGGIGQRLRDEVAVSGPWLSAAHVLRVVETVGAVVVDAKERGAVQVEAVVALWGRVVAPCRGSWGAVLARLGDVQAEEVVERVGWLNLLDPCAPELRYAIDLGRWDNRVAAAALLELAMVEEAALVDADRFVAAGDLAPRRPCAWVGTSVNGAHIELPISWASRMAQDGLLHLRYRHVLVTEQADARGGGASGGGGGASSRRAPALDEGQREALARGRAHLRDAMARLRRQVLCGQFAGEDE